MASKNSILVLEKVLGAEERYWPDEAGPEDGPDLGPNVNRPTEWELSDKWRNSIMPHISFDEATSSAKLTIIAEVDSNVKRLTDAVEYKERQENGRLVTVLTQVQALCRLLAAAYGRELAEGDRVRLYASRDVNEFVAEWEQDKCPLCNRAAGAGTLICDGCEHSFHKQCVGLKRKPRSDKWFCPICCPDSYNSALQQNASSSHQQATTQPSPTRRQPPRQATLKSAAAVVVKPSPSVVRDEDTKSPFQMLRAREAAAALCELRDQAPKADTAAPSSVTQPQQAQATKADTTQPLQLVKPNKPDAKAPSASGSKKRKASEAGLPHPVMVQPSTSVVSSRPDVVPVAPAVNTNGMPVGVSSIFGPVPTTSALAVLMHQAGMMPARTSIPSHQPVLPAAMAGAASSPILAPPQPSNLLFPNRGAAPLNPEAATGLLPQPPSSAGHLRPVHSKPQPQRVPPVGQLAAKLKPGNGLQSAGLDALNDAAKVLASDMETKQARLQQEPGNRTVADARPTAGGSAAANSRSQLVKTVRLVPQPAATAVTGSHQQPSTLPGGQASAPPVVPHLPQASAPGMLQPGMSATGLQMTEANMLRGQRLGGLAPRPAPAVQKQPIGAPSLALPNADGFLIAVPASRNTAAEGSQPAAPNQQLDASPSRRSSRLAAKDGSGIREAPLETLPGNHIVAGPVVANRDASTVGTSQSGNDILQQLSLARRNGYTGSAKSPKGALIAQLVSSAIETGANRQLRTTSATPPPDAQLPPLATTAALTNVATHTAASLLVTTSLPLGITIIEPSLPVLPLGNGHGTQHRLPNTEQQAEPILPLPLLTPQGATSVVANQHEVTAPIVHPALVFPQQPTVVLQLPPRPIPDLPDISNLEGLELKQRINDAVDAITEYLALSPDQQGQVIHHMYGLLSDPPRLREFQGWQYMLLCRAVKTGIRERAEAALKSCMGMPL